MTHKTRPTRNAVAATLIVTGISSCAGEQTHSTAPQPATQAGSATVMHPIAPAPSYQAIVDAPDRSADDRILDGGRHPVELLRILDVRPGQRVAEIGAGGGYTTELLARAVGPQGAVFGQNTPFVVSRYAEKPWSERLGKTIMHNVVRVDRNYDDPLPPEAKELDLVLINLIYHDTVWMQTDRLRMNRSIFAALRSGGAYFVIDHAGRRGTGTTETLSLHRIEEQTVRDEVQQAGFVFAAAADFLRNSSDPRDWNTAPRAAGERRGTSDRFALKFVKP